MIAIQDMKMPNTCTMCWLSNICKVRRGRPAWDGWQNRMNGCPLMEIVQCKDCKHWQCDDSESYCDELGIFNTDMNSYCSYAKRKEE